MKEKCPKSCTFFLFWSLFFFTRFCPENSARSLRSELITFSISIFGFEFYFSLRIAQTERMRKVFVQWKNRIAFDSMPIVHLKAGPHISMRNEFFLHCLGLLVSAYKAGHTQVEQCCVLPFPPLWSRIVNSIQIFQHWLCVCVSLSDALDALNCNTFNRYEKFFDYSIVFDRHGATTTKKTTFILKYAPVWCFVSFCTKLKRRILPSFFIRS